MIPQCPTPRLRRCGYCLVQVSSCCLRQLTVFVFVIHMCGSNICFSLYSVSLESLLCGQMRVSLICDDDSCVLFATQPVYRRVGTIDRPHFHKHKQTFRTLTLFVFQAAANESEALSDVQALCSPLWPPLSVDRKLCGRAKPPLVHHLPDGAAAGSAVGSSHCSVCLLHAAPACTLSNECPAVVKCFQSKVTWWHCTLHCWFSTTTLGNVSKFMSSSLVKIDLAVFDGLELLCCRLRV